MDKRIIVNADDFGLCEGVNKAVAQAHTEGVLTSATIMANMPAAEEAVEIAKQLPTLGVGVHLNLTDGQPLSPSDTVRPLLNSNGEFACSCPKLALLSVAGTGSRNAIRTELAAQIEWVIDRGIRPTHLDSHKHLHALPTLFSMVCQLARRFDIPAIRFAMEPAEVSKIPWPLPAEGGKNRAAFVRALAKINRLQNRDFLKTDGILGIAHVGRIDVNFFRAVALYHSASLTEIMTHPGFADALDPEHARLLNQRKGELDALCSEKTRRYFHDAGIELAHYGQL
jgi:hopanoid biosynthesis associated protein HpnK